VERHSNPAALSLRATQWRGNPWVGLSLRSQGLKQSSFCKKAFEYLDRHDTLCLATTLGCRVALHLATTVVSLRCNAVAEAI
jgi:hypothetical protein